MKQQKSALVIGIGQPSGKPPCSRCGCSCQKDSPAEQDYDDAEDHGQEEFEEDEGQEDEVEQLAKMLAEAAMRGAK